MPTAYLCTHHEMRSDHTTLTSRAGRVFSILVDDKGNARQLRDDPGGYKVASKRVEQEVAEILADAGWSVRPLEEGEGGEDDMAMLGGGQGSTVGLMLAGRRALDPNGQVDGLMARMAALELRDSERSILLNEMRTRVALLEERLNSRPVTIAPTVPTYDGHEFENVFPDTPSEERIADTPPPPMPKRRGRFGSRATTDADNEIAGAVAIDDGIEQQ